MKDVLIRLLLCYRDDRATFQVFCFWEKVRPPPPRKNRKVELKKRSA